MPDVNINYWAVLVAALINMVVGAVWYSPGVFGKSWAGLVGKKISDMQKNGGPKYLIAAAGAFIQAIVLGHFVQFALADTFVEGVIVGFWLWLAFAGITSLVGYTFAGRSWRLWQIDSGYFLVVLLINGGLLAAWR